MENLIEIKGLCKQYPGFALDEVSFTVPGGSIVGFVGQNGAGKTTTIKAVLDLLRPDAGSVTLLGRDAHADGPDARAGVGVVFDECLFHEFLTAAKVGRLMRDAYPGWDEAHWQALLGRLGLAGPENAKKPIKTYSRGMKMKLCLAAALAHRPRLLVLDEATSGLDPVVRDEILDIFLEFIQDDEHAILFSSHITTDIEKAADYLVFIHGGRILLNAPKDELLDRYGIVHCGAGALDGIDPAHIRGTNNTGFGVDVLIDNRDEFRPAEGMLVDPATIDDIMLLTIKGARSPKGACA